MTPRLIPVIAALVVLSGPALAQQAPGEHFVENWDLDEDGQVTLAEAQEKRGDIFYMFDQDENDVLESAEYDLFDETRAAEMAAQQEGKQAMGAEMGQGQGKGQGQGRGKGMARGRNAMGMIGMGGQGAQGGGLLMNRDVTDVNGDGTVTKAEFVSGTPAWFAWRDRNGDKVITTADFGPGR